ncbi:venom protease [Eurytemora carolleeae]|uniref:venom protease n=1 Tax=Eurytemora carolleeae TaxID=1294199 RepID=UPI000C75C786|nr:venom protease [Eurytemora carolleeae]|eukprot:XP_023342063.1 venom protease-like [Eurytemora affinis]
MCLPFVLIFSFHFAQSSEVLNLAWPEPCGTGLQRSRGMRVVGGKPAVQGQFPWVVSLRRRKNVKSSDYSHICAGTLITNRHVVTAAHCVHDTSVHIWQVVAGELRPDKRDLGEQIRKVERILNHPDYKTPSPLSHDIALISLTEGVNWSSEVSPICLPLESFSLDEKDATLVGWGHEHIGMNSVPTVFSEILMYTSIPLLSNNVCQTWFDEKNYEIIQIQDGHLCAGVKEGGHDGCKGDSGGPLSIGLESSGTLVGVVSVGVGCGLPKLPGVYTRVSSYTHWIQNFTIEDSTDSTGQSEADKKL